MTLVFREVPTADARDHWGKVYRATAETAVSWYQPHLTRSLAYVLAAGDQSTSIIDIGGGASTLVDDLLSRDYADVTVLDVAESALAQARARLGTKAEKVSWIAADITTWRPVRPYQIWHDRAVFHFLTTDSQQSAYIAALRAATLPGSTIIMATFAPDGPETCDGLPVQRYSPQSLIARLGPSFFLLDDTRETHTTPGGTEQPFSYAIIGRTA